MEEKIKELISFLQDRKEYYQAMIKYEEKFNNIKVMDCLDARNSEIEFIFWKLNRIINEKTNRP